MSTLQIRVCGRYRIQDKLYEGKYSQVYTGRNVQSDADCSIKCQPKATQPSYVMNQGRVLQALQGGVGIPHLMWFGENGDYRFLVTELLGNNLEQYLDICGGKFTLKTTCMIAEKILSSIQFIHYKNFLHRDIKPANFLMGLGKKLHQIYTIDLAFSTIYVDPKTKQHRPNINQEQKFVGTLLFTSLNVLKGNRNSRRDDLESLGLMLIYFLKGSLPWSNVNGETLKDQKKNIMKVRQEISIQKLCEGLPKQFQDYFEYCRSLKYEDIPDYTFLKRMFKERFIKQGYQFDYIYDWILIPIRIRDSDLSNRVPLNRFTKKDDFQINMCNADYDFKQDFELLEKKIEIQNKKTQKEVQLTPHRIRRSSTTYEKNNVPQNKNPTQAFKGKNVPSKGAKQEQCVIF